MAGGFVLKEEKGVVFLEVEPFQETGIARGVVSTRKGGVSQGPFESLNLSIDVGDDPEAVKENRRRYVEAAQLNEVIHMQPRQVHGAHVIRPRMPFVPLEDQDDEDGEQGGEPARRQPARRVWLTVGEGDAIVTMDTAVVLHILVADCVPVLFLDPVSRAVALAHAGWRGVLGRIVPNTISSMQAWFDTATDDVLVAIGPSIGQCCYQVDREVMDPLRTVYPGADEFAIEDGPGHWRLDLKGLIRHSLEDFGVRPESIFVSDYCTACSQDLFFSHRGSGGTTGRFAASIVLLER